MSRYSIFENNKVYIIGWDPPGNSYFFQQWKNKEEFNKGDDVEISLGYLPNEFIDIDIFIKKVNQYISINHLKEQLTQDKLKIK